MPLPLLLPLLLSCRRGCTVCRCCLHYENLPVPQDSRVEVATIATACEISARGKLLAAIHFFTQKSWTRAQLRDSSTTWVLNQPQTATKSSFSMLVCQVPGSVDKYLPVADCPLQKSLEILMAFQNSADIGITTPISALHVLCLRSPVSCP